MRELAARCRCSHYLVHGASRKVYLDMFRLRKSNEIRAISTRCRTAAIIFRCQFFFFFSRYSLSLFFPSSSSISASSGVDSCRPAISLQAQAIVELPHYQEIPGALLTTWCRLVSRFHAQLKISKSYITPSVLCPSWHTQFPTAAMAHPASPLPFYLERVRE
jgi:hypothetical protein